MKRPEGLQPQFASDNWSGVCPEAWVALAESNAGHAPAYGGDDWTVAAAAAICELFETQCDVFFVYTGTAANSLGLAQMVRQTDAIIAHASAHINVDECGAPHFFSGGARVVTADTPHGKLTVEAIQALAVTPHDVHSARPGAVSLTQATELGTVYSPLEMWEIAQVAHKRGMKLHVDGARFANAVASLGVAPADIAWRAGVDVLSLGGTKNGLPFGEAIVFFDRALAEEFGRRRMQGGQLASKMRYLAAPWLGVLRSGAWLRHATHANAMARRLADAIAGVPGTRLLAPVEANGVFVDVPLPMIAALRERGWQFYEFVGATGIRLMCSWDMTPEIVDRFAADVRELAGANA
ncbi:MAG: low specificity L-threonine aldolase [Burkholderiales bacterium]|nr:low specificity L-threonine aldolase [Burkholderiales bacterium]